MACEVCEHCHGSFSRGEGVAVRNGFSYHKKCHKCYVCSETNLHKAEVFKGVIFCSSCAHRIFQGCSAARRTKNSRHKRSPTRVNRRRERNTQDEKLDQNRDGVIELARLAGSVDSSKSNSDGVKVTDKSSKALTEPGGLALQVTNKTTNANVHVNNIRKDSNEMGMTTEVTQELLKQIQCPVITDCKYGPFQPRRHRPRYSGDEHNNIIYSDLRIAELGASTEIANMALRKKSELPVIIKSKPHLKRTDSFTFSELKQYSGNISISSRDERDWMESPHSTINDFTKTHWLDRRIGSILKLPYKCFKKNILNRSSLVSVLMSCEDDKFSLLKNLKQLFCEEMAEHRDRGFRKLYPAINGNRTPYKLGWLQLVAKASQVQQCKHFKRSHSYRCMRSHVMKLAGPTKSELAVFRNKVKRFIAPSFFKRFIASQRRPAITVTQACGSR